MSQDERNESDDEELEDVEAPGWDAIDAALRPIYGDGEPKNHFGTVIPYSLGGPDPIRGISVYEVAEPTPHWHYVTYGFSELYEKESDDPATSVFGFELTMRVAQGSGEPEPGESPRWPLSLLQSLARYVFQTGNRFAVGHHMSLGAPLAEDVETRVQSIGVARDPALPAQIDTPNGTVAFLQLVGLTDEELAAAQAWNTEKLLELLEEHHPWGVTDLRRGSPLDEAECRERVEQGIEQDGSSMGSTYDTSLAFVEEGDQVTVRFDVRAVAGLRRAMKGRLLHDRPFMYINGEERTAVTFVRADEETPVGVLKDEDDDLVLVLDDALIHKIRDELPEELGAWRLSDEVTFEVIAEDEGDDEEGDE
ncbi:MAG TPA: hypothetical protein DEA08_37500 [Planctomycetes bacterium]|nr:hypothetical protein [Planctomycetota bacterium]